MRLIALAGLCLALSGCSTFSGGNSAIAEKALSNLEHCKRSYTAAIGMGAGGSLVIECPPRPYPVEAVE